MKRTLRLALFASLIPTLLPKTAVAKAPTVKILISGRRLIRPVEIADPQLLALSNVWSGQFLDTSKAPETEPPNALSPLEVSFFVKVADHEIRKMYVVCYYPRARGQGFLYLPGKGAAYWRNVSTILREGRDGKWNYASPEWETLIKLSLSHKQAKLGPTDSGPLAR